MLDDDNLTGPGTPAEPSSSRTPPADGAGESASAETPSAKKAAKRTAAKKAPAKKAVKKTATKNDGSDPAADASPAQNVEAQNLATEAPAAKKTARKRAAKKVAPAEGAAVAPAGSDPEPAAAPAQTRAASAVPLFVAPDAAAVPAPRKRAAKKSAEKSAEESAEKSAKKSAEKSAKKSAKKSAEKPAKVSEEQVAPVADEAAEPSKDKPARRRSTKARPTVEDPASEETGDSGRGSDSVDSADDDDSGTKRRPRRRGGRRRRKGNGEDDETESNESAASDPGKQSGDQNGDENGDRDGEEAGSSSTASRRRRRRRRSGDEGGGGSDDPDKTVTRVRKTRNPEDEITALSGSTRLEAKKQRRREGREAGRRRAPIVSEAEFLARREAVDRVMVIRQRDDLTQIGVLEDKVLVEHYVARESQTSLIGNVYLGRVQNVLPSMEAAFIDIGKGRNAVLYAGEVNWTSLGAKDNQPRKIESFLKSGQPVLVQVSKDPIGHKGARLTSQVSLPGRFLVYVPDGTTSGISRKLPDNERNRLKTLLKEIVPDTAGVIVRTAAEGATEEELTQDVERLTARWGDIEAKVKAGQSPQLLYGEPDLTLKVVRDLFTEDFAKLVVQGGDAWDLVESYVNHVAPDLQERLERYRPEDHDGTDLFASYRLDEQIAKGLDRKVWLPSGGSLIIDRTEAMTVVDVNTGKFTGSGGNLEETVTKNNLEAAEEIVRQLRLRDIGGIIVIDFIDMVLESNRDLVLRRMVECLGRDRTRHQVAEVTSLGLVQMTRKRIGTGLLEAFSEDCAHCNGRGLTTHDHPIEPSTKMDDDDRRGGRRGRGGRGRSGSDSSSDGSGSSRSGNGHPSAPSPKDVAAVARAENANRPPLDGKDDTQTEQLTPDTAEDSALATPVTADSAGPTVDGTELYAGSGVTPTAPDDAEPEPLIAPREPAQPTVVTTRRRSARRAAGPPVGVPAVDGAPDAVATAPDESAAADGDDGGDGDDERDENGVLVMHVPVKRKGSRKR